MDLGYYVLYLHHGFGNKRIVRLEGTINEYLERAQSEKEMKTLLERMKIQSQTQQAINSMILKSGDVKPVEKVNKSEEKSEKEKENV